MRAAGGLSLTALALAGAMEVRAADPLFESRETLAVRITGPLRSLARDRDDDPEYRPGTLAYTDAGGTVRTLEIKLRPRGHSRRQSEVCRVPPLRVNFRKTAVLHTLFDGQDKLKLVTHCRYPDRHDEYVYKEYLAYRLLNQITDAGFRVRGLDIEWVDADRNDRTERRFGFFIEHKDRLAKRLGWKEAETGGIDLHRLDPDHASLMELFEFMIGNTDFSLIAPREGDECCHNATLFLGPDERYRPVPYDFDMSGFVDPPYAVVSDRLPIDDVRRRLYRGFCRDGDAHARAVTRFREARGAVFATLEQETPLDASSRAGTVEFIEDFYAVIDDPQALEREVLEACRG